MVEDAEAMVAEAVAAKTAYALKVLEDWRRKIDDALASGMPIATWCRCNCTGVYIFRKMQKALLDPDSYVAKEQAKARRGALENFREMQKQARRKAPEKGPEPRQFVEMLQYDAMSPEEKAYIVGGPAFELDLDGWSLFSVDATTDQVLIMKGA